MPVGSGQKVQVSWLNVATPMRMGGFAIAASFCIQAPVIDNNKRPAATAAKYLDGFIAYLHQVTA
jgi:hypothetical protein